MTFPQRVQWMINIAFDGNKNRAAIDLGVNPSTIHRWIDNDYTGIAQISIETIGKLYNIGINPVWFAAEMGERYSDNKSGMFLKRKLNGETSFVPTDKLDEIHSMLKELIAK